MPRIEHLSALEILDSRGRPTVLAACRLSGGAIITASVPSGASTGSAEAIELRDEDPNHYNGLGCRKAVHKIKTEIAQALTGKDFQNQAELDLALIDLDGTPDKSRLGANSILAVSIAFARACAAHEQRPLHEHFADIAGAATRQRLPRLTINLFSGGKHAGGQVPIQDVLLVPITARTIDESLASVYAIYQSAARLTQQKYGARPLKADEGGLAPPFPNVEIMLDDAVEAIRLAGFEPGREIALAVDVASTHFFNDGFYRLADRALDSSGMIQTLRSWIDQWPIVSIEDGLAENDWENWPLLREAIGSRCLVLGDDLLCTNPKRIRRAVDSSACNALLLKVNQIGTLTEAADALDLARSAGWKITVSARSGETEDNWLADLAVGWRADQIKVGSIQQSERLSKYNRLLMIEASMEST
jgi:enolase